MNRLRQLAAFLLSGLAIAVAALAVFAGLAREVFTGGTRALDFGARAFVARIASPPLTFFMRGFSLLGESFTLLGLVALCFLLFWRAGRRRAALLLALTMAGAGLLDAALKLLFHRQRPAPFFGTALPASYSFPSGHALASCCFFGALAAMLTVREPRRSVRIAVWTAAVLLAALIGSSRIYLGVHYASDVIAGYAAAIVWVFAVEAAYRRTLRR